MPGDRQKTIRRRSAAFRPTRRVTLASRQCAGNSTGKTPVACNSTGKTPVAPAWTFLIAAVLLVGCRDDGPQTRIAKGGLSTSPSGQKPTRLAAGISTTISKPSKLKRSLLSFPRFSEVHEAAGVEFRYDTGAVGKALMVESTGGGVGWLDFDGDSVWDLYFIQGGNPTPAGNEELPGNVLYRNLGEGTFLDVSRAAGVAHTGYGQGLAVGDFDDDGFDDIYVTNVGRNVLYHNQGDGTFRDVTGEAGVGDELWASSAAWGDLDGDGDLDLFLCNYVKYDPYDPVCCQDDEGNPAVCHPEHLDPQPNECFQNEGNGRFTPIARQWGLRGEGGKSLGVVIADLNGDGLPDVFVANDTTANFLFVNKGHGTFEESATRLGCALSGRGLFQASMGIALGDYDRNGFLDLYVTHFAQDSNTLYANLGPAGFYDTTRTTGLHQPTLPYLGFGTVMNDFNADSHEDLFVTNGHIADWRKKGDLLEMPAQLFSFDGQRWVDSSDHGGLFFQETGIGRAVAGCDYDDDGDMDLAIVHQNATAALLRNDSQRGHWLKLRLIGRVSNRRGVGAAVTVEQGDDVLVDQLAGGTSFCSAHQPALFFGLGQSSAECTISIRWPNGIHQKMRGVSVDQTLVISEPRVPPDDRTN